MVTFWLLAACSLGFLGVAFGAFGAHALRNVLDEYGRTIYDRAVSYQMFHALALFGVGVIQHLFRDRSFRLAGWVFSSGSSSFQGASLDWRSPSQVVGSNYSYRGLFISLRLDLLFYRPGKGRV